MSGLPSYIRTSSSLSINDSNISTDVQGMLLFVMGTNVAFHSQERVSSSTSSRHFLVFVFFIGDLADRYWSGYSLSYVPGNSKLLSMPVGARDIKGWFHPSTKRDQKKNPSNLYC